MTHGEGLSGKCAVLDDCGEKLAFFHIGKNKSHSVVVLGKAFHNVRSVNIVDFSAVFLDIAVKEILKASDCKL